MKLSTALLAGALALTFAIPAAAADNNGNAMLFGIGTNTCAKVLADAKGRKAGTYVDWVTGMMSGYTRMLNGVVDIGSSLQSELPTPYIITNATYKMCIDYPKLTFGTAAIGIIEQIIQNDAQAANPSAATPTKSLPGAMKF